MHESTKDRAHTQKREAAQEEAQTEGSRLNCAFHDVFPFWFVNRSHQLKGRDCKTIFMAYFLSSVVSDFPSRHCHAVTDALQVNVGVA